jgi:hypothetical protein
MSNNYPAGMSTADLIYVGEIADPDEIDQDDFTDWAEDKAIEIIVDNLAFYFAEYAERLADQILETFLTTDRDWSALRDTNTGSQHLMLCQMAEWYVEDHEEDLEEEYRESLED